MGDKLISLKIFFMKLWLTIFYQIILISTCVIIAVFVVSPFVMGATCIALKMNIVPALGYFKLWLIAVGLTAVPVYITEEVRYFRNRKKLIQEHIKKADEAMKESQE